MILITGGDSWTQGDSPAQTINWNAPQNLDWYSVPMHFGDPTQFTDDRMTSKFYDSSVWPKVIGGSKIFNKVYNLGRLGDDASGTVRKVINFINYKNFKEEVFVIVGWTSPLRYSIFNLNQDAKRIGLEQTRPHNDDFFDIVQKLEVVYNRFFLDVLNLQNFLKLAGINYLFFNAFDHADENSSPFESLIDQDKWVDKTMYKSHFKKHIITTTDIDLNPEEVEKRRREFIPNDGKYFHAQHPTDISHIIWGKYLTQYIKDNNLI